MFSSRSNNNVGNFTADTSEKPVDALNSPLDACKPEHMGPAVYFVAYLCRL